VDGYIEIDCSITRIYSVNKAVMKVANDILKVSRDEVEGLVG
jgi:hypothetical protein